MMNMGMILFDLFFLKLTKGVNFFTLDTIL